MAVAGKLWVRGKWGDGKSSEKDSGQTAYNLTGKGDAMYFYAGDLSDDRPTSWQDQEGSKVYSVVQSDGSYGGDLEIYADATGVVWGKVVQVNKDGDVSFTKDLHGGTIDHEYDETITLGEGGAVYVERSD